MRFLNPLIVFLFCVTPLLSQTSFCPEDPPINEWLAVSPWPTFHRNSYRQSSTCITGPVAGDQLTIKSRTNITGGTSPWVYLSDFYPNGERVMYQSNATHVFKFIDTPEGIVTIDSFRVDFDPLTSFGYSFVLSKNKVWFAPDPKHDPEQNRYSRILKFTDEDIDDPYSDIIKIGEYSFAGTGIIDAGHLAINYSGQVLFSSKTDEETNQAATGILDQDLNLLATLFYPTLPGEIVNHNSFPIDENNSWYIVTTHRMIRFDWDGNDISIGWEAAYDFVADGPTGSFAEGSGTTPTLMGWEDGQDKLIVLADGHNQNNLVAFWREVPDDWTALPGYNIRYAGNISIPLAQASNNLFQSIENSPTVYGYEVAIAQYNGFLGYDCVNEKGVQKFTWNTQTNQFELNWATDELNMNGVLTYSSGSGLVYSSGKEDDCNYYLYGLNWNTGNLDVRVLLGPEGSFTDDPFYDTGNNIIIDEQGDLLFPGGSSLVKVEVIGSVSTNDPELGDRIRVFPNPVLNSIYLEAPAEVELQNYLIRNIEGKTISKGKVRNQQISVRFLPPGIYYLDLPLNNQRIIKKIIKV